MLIRYEQYPDALYDYNFFKECLLFRLYCFIPILIKMFVSILSVFVMSLKN